MSVIEVPLSKFMGYDSSIINTLYATPNTENSVHLHYLESDDTQKFLELPTVEGYNPKRDHTPSVIWDDKFEIIFGCKNVCIHDPYYKLYCEIKNHIVTKIEADGAFGYVHEKTVENDEPENSTENIHMEFEVNNIEDIERFLDELISKLKLSLYDIKTNIGLV